MTEIDLNQAITSWGSLAYTSSQWWLTVTTALVVATYLAAKHIPAWLFALIALLYALTALSVIFEVSIYSELSYGYGVRLMELRISNHEIGAEAQPGALWRHFNLFLNYAIFAVGSLGALSFSFVHWRKARSS
jgi:hypothetical protein